MLLQYPVSIGCHTLARIPPTPLSGRRHPRVQRRGRRRFLLPPIVGRAIEVAVAPPPLHRAQEQQLEVHLQDPVPAADPPDGAHQRQRAPHRHRPLPGKVARWQILIPSFSWIAPGWRAWGAQSKERKGSNFAIWQPWAGAVVSQESRVNR